MGEYWEMIAVSTANLFLFFAILYSAVLMASPDRYGHFDTWKRRVSTLLAMCLVSFGIVLLLWVLWGV